MKVDYISPADAHRDELAPNIIDLNLPLIRDAGPAPVRFAQLLQASIHNREPLSRLSGQPIDESESKGQRGDLSADGFGVEGVHDQFNGQQLEDLLVGEADAELLFQGEYQIHVT